MKEMKTLKFPNQDEAYEIVDAKARENKAEKSDLEDLADLVDVNATAIESLQKQVLPTSLILADAITGESHTIQIQNGQLVSFKN